MKELHLELNSEMHNIGEFLYTGCEALYQTGPFIMDYEVFNIFYNLSVGIERMQKVILVLNKDQITDSQYKFLTKHNLQELQSIINSLFKVQFSKNENKLLGLLTDFYNNGRYYYLDKKFHTAPVYGWSIKKLSDYLVSNNLENLGDFTTQFNLPENSKINIIKSINLILSKYIKLIKSEASKRRIYTIETQSNFKFSIFYYGSVIEKTDIFNYFKMADISKNELYYFFLQATLEKIDDKTNILKDFPPLDFDTALIADFLSEKTLSKVKWDLIEHVEGRYEELYDDDCDKISERKKFIESFFDYFNFVFDSE